jgi:hypothetical protein
MRASLKYNQLNFSQILISNQLVVDAVFAFYLRNLLIIIIFALCSVGTNKILKSFFFQDNNSISAVIKK